MYVCVVQGGSVGHIVGGIVVGVDLLINVQRQVGSAGW